MFPFYFYRTAGGKGAKEQESDSPFVSWVPLVPAAGGGTMRPVHIAFLEVYCEERRLTLVSAYYVPCAFSLPGDAER